MPTAKPSRSAYAGEHGQIDKSTSVLWVGASEGLREAVRLHSFQIPSQRLELRSGAGLEFKLYALDGGVEDLSLSTAVMAHDEAFRVAQIRLLKLFRQSSAAFVVLEYDPNTIQFWSSFFDRYNIEFCLYFPRKETFSWAQWAFLCAATARLVSSEDLYTWWKSSLIFDAEVVTDGGRLLEHVGMQIRHLLEAGRFHATRPDRAEASKLAIVSYYFPPARSVAMQRLNYWSEEIYNISEAAGHTLDPHIITAVNHYAHPEHVTVIRDFGDFIPLHGQFKRLHDLLKKHHINTIGVSWYQKLRETMSKNTSVFQADTVVFSGNPFFYFELGEWYKETYGSVIIYDFRDPFADNPRIKYTVVQRHILRDLERTYLKHADAALAVNRACLDLIVQSRSVDYIEIANGYDERIVEKAKPTPRLSHDRVRFIYTGTFYRDCSPEKFVKCLDKDRHEFEHYGLRQKDHDTLLDYETFNWHGPTSYPDVVSAAKSSDVGLIFTGGEKFEQTTKIFDYIAADLDIIIITEGKPRTGEIHNMTCDLERVYWLENKKSKIEEFLSTYEPGNGTRQAKASFTRQAQTRKLVDLSKQLHDPETRKKRAKSRSRVIDADRIKEYRHRVLSRANQVPGASPEQNRKPGEQNAASDASTGMAGNGTEPVEGNSASSERPPAASRNKQDATAGPGSSSHGRKTTSKTGKTRKTTSASSSGAKSSKQAHRKASSSGSAGKKSALGSNASRGQSGTKKSPAKKAGSTPALDSSKSSKSSE